MTTAVTTELAQRLHTLASAPITGDVTAMGTRSLVNVIGTAIGASQKPATDLYLRYALDTAGPGPSAVLGRSERLTLLDAVVANGLAAHLDDFDDAHLATVIHPAAAAMAASLGVAEVRHATGAQAFAGFVWGCEVSLRIGVAMSPEHYEDGWHITGTCAPAAGAVAAGVVLDLDAERLANAIGLAASQTLGQREGFGSMLKPFHPGKGAANGVHAALLAEKGFTAPTDALEDPRGYFSVLSPRGHRPGEVLEGLGDRFELLDNTFKPYPCGVVTHPIIDAGIELSELVTDPREVREVVARVNPLVLDLTGNPNPTTGLEGRFSSFHGLAVSLVDGRVGLEQYRDERVVAPDVTALRGCIRFEPDPAVERDAAHVRLELSDRTLHHADVTHARGSRERPLSDHELRAKVHDLVEPTLPGATDAIFEQVERMPSAESVDALLAVSRRHDR